MGFQPIRIPIHPLAIVVQFTWFFGSGSRFIVVRVGLGTVRQISAGKYGAMKGQYTSN
jgi:hypothetical protein